MLIGGFVIVKKQGYVALFELQRTLVNVLGVMRFTVLCNALCIARINEKAGSIRQLFVNTACFFCIMLIAYQCYHSWLTT